MVTKARPVGWLGIATFCVALGFGTGAARAQTYYYYPSQGYYYSSPYQGYNHPAQGAASPNQYATPPAPGIYYTATGGYQQYGTPASPAGGTTARPSALASSTGRTPDASRTTVSTSRTPSGATNVTYNVYNIYYVTPPAPQPRAYPTAAAPGYSGAAVTTSAPSRNWSFDYNEWMSHNL